MLVQPGKTEAVAAVEDDIHCMRVTLRHDGDAITAVDAEMARAPWTTCPGAVAVLRQTFLGVPLAEAARRAMPLKKANCTHLHDLAVLAATHARDDAPFEYRLFASDPVDGAHRLELHRDGRRILRWHVADGLIVAPAAIAGRSLVALRDWIATLPAAEAEAARVLQWGGLVAHGRWMPLSRQSDARALPPNCYSFQPERASVAVRNGPRIDFSRASRAPLALFDGHGFGPDPDAQPEPPTPL